mmetsp:Transcript_12514/g.25482  ORF Transcript_12514/g.25482 Transcript_12514/m.25482 type:complete len:110 (+) Transcript_12514:722-1051(+)
MVKNKKRNESRGNNSIEGTSIELSSCHLIHHDVPMNRRSFTHHSFIHSAQHSSFNSHGTYMTVLAPAPGNAPSMPCKLNVGNLHRAMSKSFLVSCNNAFETESSLFSFL